jgi:hypothetical protein
MSWRDLKPFPDDWSEPERPHVSEADRPGYAGEITLTFADEVSRQWFAAWVRSKRGWTAFLTWVDERR